MFYFSRRSFCTLFSKRANNVYHRALFEEYEPVLFYNKLIDRTIELFYAHRRKITSVQHRHICRDL